LVKPNIIKSIQLKTQVIVYFLIGIFFES